MQTKIIPLLFCLLVYACASKNSPIPLPTETIQVQEGQSVFIRLDVGEITVLGGEDKQVRVDGETLFPDQTEYNVTNVSNQIQIVAKSSGNRSSHVSLSVRVPDHIKLKIETEYASIAIHDYVGDVEAASTSGDIVIQNVRGNIVARSNRGDVNVQASTGKVSVVGNYGLLTLERTNGDVGVSTIMGTITFKGPIRAGDDVRLETDHGPVAVHLSQDSNLVLQVRSTSGDVACLLPNLSTSLRACDGAFHSGDGALTIRTVSGAVTLQLIP
jgi:hypothetical protein